MSHILVVTSDRAELSRAIRTLNDAGYSASGGSTFEEATRLLKLRTPDLVIADVRLGAYNGLHVILRARAESPDVNAIVTAPAADRGLELDASRLNVQYMLKPQNQAEWLGAVSRAFDLSAVVPPMPETFGALHAID